MERRELQDRDSGIRRISALSVRHQVFQQLKEQLVSGSWTPGMKIPSETELAQRLGVSRVSVREGLHRLSAMGVLETRRGEGTFVRKMSSDSYMQTVLPWLIVDEAELKKLLEYRWIVEPRVAAVSAQKATAEDIAELERIYVYMQTHVHDTEEFARADVDFHLAIAESTKNPIVSQVNSVISDLLRGFMKTIVEVLGVEDGLHYHQQLLSAIKERDSDRASAIMDEHVARTIDRINQNSAFVESST